MKTLLILTLVLFALTGCQSAKLANAALIEPGMTKQQVREIMGEPGDRQFNGNREVWQYGQTGAGFGYHDYRVVWFRDGIVVGLTSYKSHRAGTTAAGQFKTVDWSEEPDAVIEVRQR